MFEEPDWFEVLGDDMTSIIVVFIVICYILLGGIFFFL